MSTACLLLALPKFAHSVGRSRIVLQAVILFKRSFPPRIAVVQPRLRNILLDTRIRGNETGSLFHRSTLTVARILVNFVTTIARFVYHEVGSVRGTYSRLTARKPA